MSLQGTLSTLGITEVLEFLASRSASGRLDVTTEMGTASFELIEGGVAKADYSFMRESGVDAAEATYYVVSELDGTFFFDDDLVMEVIEGGEPPEEVGSVLARTVEIAEKWADVEDVIATPNHLLIRNEEIDGSVTIQPEWWKALQVIGDGKTSLQLASELELGSLDASLTALAMTNAGLLLVQEVDPLDIEIGVQEDLTMPAEPALLAQPVDAFDIPEPVIAEPVSAVPQMVAEPEAPAPEPPAFYAPPAADEPEMYDPAPAFDAAPSFDEAPSFDAAPSFDSTPAPEPAALAGHPQPVAEATPHVDPIFEPVDMLEMVDVEPPMPEAQNVAATTGASGMDDLSSLEFMLESDGQVGPAPTSPEAQIAASDDTQPSAPEIDEEDGWSSGHTAGAGAFEPMAPQPAPAMEQAPPMSFGSPAPVEPSPFDVPAEPVPDAFGAMELADLPDPPPPLVEPTSATAMAGEVLDDLASMSDELNDVSSTEENWQLDGTFVPDDTPEEPRPHADPFGDLGHLLEDDSGSDRGSVLKFLRRD